MSADPLSDDDLAAQVILAVQWIECKITETATKVCATAQQQPLLFEPGLAFALAQLRRQVGNNELGDAVLTAFEKAVREEWRRVAAKEGVRRHY